MIRPSDKKKMKKVLGTRFGAIIINHLTDQKILNSKGEPYTINSLSPIINGKRQHEVIEFEIAKLVSAERERKEKLAEHQKELFK